MKSGSNVWVEIDLEALLLGDFFVSIFNLLSDPIGEDRAHDAGDDITDPLSRNFVELAAIGQVIVDLVGVEPAELLDRF